MTSQIFKTLVPPSKLLDFLSRVCTEEDGALKMTGEAYKRALFHNHLTPFLEDLVEHYHASKQFYVTRKMTYPRCITVVRQLCKHMRIPFSSRVVYLGASYDIVYFIYPSEEWGAS